MKCPHCGNDIILGALLGSAKSKRGARTVLYCLMAVSVVCLARFFLPESDEARFQSMLAAGRSYSEAVSAERGPWGCLLVFLHQSRHFSKIYEAKRDTLLASAYLTNLTFKVPLDTARREEWERRRDALLHGTNVYAILLRLEPDEETFQFRTRDVGALYHALGE